MVTHRPWIIGCAVVVALTALATAYLTVAGMVEPDTFLPGSGTHAGRTLGLYEAVRSTVLIGALVTALVSRSWRAMRWLLVLNAVTQFGDGVVGAVQQHSAAATIGPLVFAVALGVCSLRRFPLTAAPQAERWQRASSAAAIGPHRFGQPVAHEEN